MTRPVLELRPSRPADPPERAAAWRNALAASAVGVCALAWAVMAAAQPVGERRGPTTAPADPGLAAQRDICFAHAAPEEVKTFQAEAVVLWTDAPVDGRAIVAHLHAVAEYLRARLPVPAPARRAASRPAGAGAAPAKPRPVAVAIYATADEYQRLWRRVGAHYGGTFGRVETEGYSYRVFCATSHDDARQFAARRSVICHEFAHVWLYQRHGLRNDGNWLTEGIATAVQLHFFPESGNRRDFLRWMETGRMLPLKRLMDLARVRPKDYWQAGTLIELLLRRYPGKLSGVVAAFNRNASANAIVTDVLGADFSTLGKQWAESIRAATSGRSAPSSRRGAL